MNITKSVNIANSLFVMDEDAYDHLSAYLDDISSRIESASECSDIINEVEIRCSEIFRENGVTGCRVVDIKLVEYTISLIGTPNIFGDKQGGRASTNNPPLNSRKRLMRDSKDKMLGGVCSGVAAYFGIDVTAVRAIMFLFAFFVGSGVLAYIIAWLVIPVTKSKEEIDLMREMKENI